MKNECVATVFLSKDAVLWLNAGWNNLFYSVQLSFAPLFPPGSVYRDEFDLAILKLQEDNRLEILKRKWWDGGKCPKEEDHRAKGLSGLFFSTISACQTVCLKQHFVHFHFFRLLLLILPIPLPVSLLTLTCPMNVLFPPGLGMENIGGIFVVLVCGLLAAIFMAVLEFVWMLRQTPGTEVREGYLTCICFVSLSPPWHPPPRGAARLSHSAQLWQEKMSSSGFHLTPSLLPSSLWDIISTKPKIYLTYSIPHSEVHAYMDYFPNIVVDS